jgi:hypothetical protein
MQDPTRGVVAVGCLVVLVVAGAAAVSGAATAERGIPAQHAQDAPPGAAIQESVDPDVVVMRADVAADGDARWSVAYRTRLDDANTTAAFESLQADIEANRSAYTDRFGTGMRRTVRAAENRTGRGMALENLTVTADTEQFGQEYGVVTYRFTWTSFAAVDGGRLRVGDALAGLFLDSETSLVVAYPDEYDVVSASPRPAENRTNAVVWRGQIDFGPDEPRLVLAPGGAASGPGTAVLAGGAVAVLALLAGGYLVVRRRGVDAVAGGDESGASEGGDADGATPAADDGAEGPPEELLSNEERVLKLLDEEGGRVKQQRIASEFDWTDAKTSQVVGGLDEAGDVEKFRIGRENVVALPEESDLGPDTGT